MSAPAGPKGLTCPVCRVSLDPRDDVTTCEQCGWAPRQGAD